MPKEKLTLYLEQEMIVWLHSKTDPELKVSAVVRNLIRDKMSLESRRKTNDSPNRFDEFDSNSNKNYSF